MIYLDNAAAAPVNPKALAAAMPFLTENFANPSSAHTPGREASATLNKAREQCAAALGALPEEICFTSGGTESDNLAVFSALNANGKHRVVTTEIEHPAVLSACEEARRRGFEVVRVKPGSDGIVRAEDISAAINDDTALVSVMTANNEIGTLQPIAEIGAVCRERGAIFHTDAVQAVGNIPLDMQKLPVDMLSVSAHKIGGVKGGGLLFVRKGVPISPIIFGGGQERGIRSGTENTAAIAALGEAMKYASDNIPRRAEKIAELRDLLIERLTRIPDSGLNGSRTARICSNVSFSFAGIDGEALVMSLDLMGVCASAASACAAGRRKRSHVMTALGLPDKWLNGTLRLSLSESNTRDEILTAADIITLCVERQRSGG